MTKSISNIDTSKMAFDPLCKERIFDKYPELKSFHNLKNEFTEKIFRYICLIYDNNSPLFKMLLSERKNLAMKTIGLSDPEKAIESNQLEEVKWCANLFFTMTNNPALTIFISLDEAFNNLLEKARTKPMEIDEAQEKIAYEGIAKAADNAFEMYGKLKNIKNEFSKEFGEFDILDAIKKSEKIKHLEAPVNFAEERARKKAAEEAKNKK